MSTRCYRKASFFVLAFILTSLVVTCHTSVNAQEPNKLPPGPMLNGGQTTLIAKDLRLSLLRYSGTAAQLSPSADSGIDYTPGDLLQDRSADTFYHLGDLDLRLRSDDTATWTDYSTAYRRKPVRVLESSDQIFRSDLADSLPADIPLNVVRTWSVQNGQLRLQFKLTNRTQGPVHLGGVGIPMVFNNILNGRTLEESYSKCSFYDPYIGEDAGYVQVIRLTGKGSVLLVVPDGKTPLEAWKPILDKRVNRGGEGLLLNDPTPRGTTFEGSYDWMVHSAAFAETDWKGVEEWNPPTEALLKPGESVTYGLRFFTAPSLRNIENTLAENNRPVAVGVPGYILPQDVDGRLFLRASSPVASITSEPVGALAIHDDGLASDKQSHAYTVHGVQWGRSRLHIVYADGIVQNIAYRTIKPETDAIKDMGHFLFHEQWFNDSKDPFHRAPSIISYDNSIGKQVVQEPRVWIAGLSDEGGAGSWIAAAMKESIQPDVGEVEQLEQFVNKTIWGHLQISEGEQKYGVQKSVFFYQPDAMPPGYYNPDFNWKSWTSWDKKGAADVGRSFNYPHVVAAYWSLYHIARNTQGLVKQQTWQWYLNQAFQTVMAMKSQAPYYTQFGHMEGTIFTVLLQDMKKEGWTAQAQVMESWMRERAMHWSSEPYPFGSEMPWDSTGQEEVYAWTRHFGFDDKADVTLNAILAYTPVIPSWGYNGSARRYWDFLYGGKYPRIERQLHHYGSGLNAIPLLTEYRAHPTDLYLLRAGYGGVMGPLANIDEKGFASAAFHSFPDRMQYDPYTGDYGPNFLGHVLNTGAYLVHDAAFGWLAFGGNVGVKGKTVELTVLDSSRQRVYIAPESLWLTLDAGQFKSVEYNIDSHRVSIHLVAAGEHVKKANLRIEIIGAAGQNHAPETRMISLTAGETVVSMTP